jgi:hypothetical protein
MRGELFYRHMTYRHSRKPVQGVTLSIVILCSLLEDAVKKKPNNIEQDLSFDQMEQTVIALLARGETVSTAANISGVSERTIYRRKETPEFKAKLAEFRAWMFSSVAGNLLEAFPKASDVLLELAQHEDPHVRYKAAVKLIEFAFKVRELDDGDRRLENLKIIVRGPAQPGRQPDQTLPENPPQLAEGEPSIQSE